MLLLPPAEDRAAVRMWPAVAGVEERDLRMLGICGRAAPPVAEIGGLGFWDIVWLAWWPPEVVGFRMLRTLAEEAWERLARSNT